MTWDKCVYWTDLIMMDWTVLAVLPCFPLLIYPLQKQLVADVLQWKPPELESHFNKTVCNFIKKWLYDRCFHVNIAKFLRTFKNTFFYRISPDSLCLYTCQLIPNKHCVNKYEVIEVVTNTCSTHIYFIPMSIYFM